MIDNDFNHVYTENVNKGPVPQNKSSALILFFWLMWERYRKERKKKMENREIAQAVIDAVGGKEISEVLLTVRLVYV